jgi:2-polyprenyl-6-methoxyphenol hydroxylase-like FAD-dependent oxidoreductase
MLADLLAPFGAPLVQSIRAQVGPQSHCIYRPLESLLLPQPWFDARVVLVGDAVHATTPHMAAGAGIGIEDGIVLAEELGRGATVQAALQAFQARRWERCRMVVENSGRLGEIEISGGDKAEHTRIMHETHQRLAQQSTTGATMETNLSAAHAAHAAHVDLPGGADADADAGTRLRASGIAVLLISHCAGMVDLVALPVWWAP